MIFINILLLTALMASANAGSLQNKEVETYVDASTQLITVKNVVTIKNTNSRPQPNYIFIVDPQWAHNMSFISATDEREQTLKINKIDDIRFEYEIQLAPLLPDETVKIYIFSVITNYLQSYPKTVRQGQKHLVLFQFNIYYYSLYFTQNQTTFIHLGSTEIERIEGIQYKSTEINGHANSLISGPYVNIEPMSNHQSIIHYKISSPFISVEKLERFIQLSHWGFIQVKEHITVINSGPKFAGPFKRQTYLPPDTRIESFTTTLPGDAIDIHLRDEIGYLWSFDTNFSDSNKVLVNIRPRYVMYGGWKTKYQISYSLPISNYIVSDPDSLFFLNVPLVDVVFPNMFIKEAEINIILPEGAVYLDEGSYFKYVNHTGKKYCYFLDIICREIVTLKFHNLVEKHSITVKHVYFYPYSLMFIKPLLTAAYIYVVLIFCTIFMRTLQSSSKVVDTKVMSTRRQMPVVSKKSDRLQAEIKGNVKNNQNIRIGLQRRLT